MTLKEFNNLKVGDSYYSYSIFNSAITKHIVMYTGWSSMKIRFIFSESNKFYEPEIKDYYIDEGECLIDFIKNRKEFLIEQLNCTNNKLSDLNKQYSKFIKENVEHFI